VLAAGKRHSGVQKAPHIVHQLVEFVAAVMQGNGLVELFPEPLDSVDLRMVGRLIERLEFRMRFEREGRIDTASADPGASGTLSGAAGIEASRGGPREIA
jgi:hypothetical protein